MMEVTLESKPFFNAKTTVSQDDLGKDIHDSEVLKNEVTSELHSEVRKDLQKQGSCKNHISS